MKLFNQVAQKFKTAFLGIGYSFHILFHPFDGFYDLKHEKRGNPYTATLFIFLLILVFIFQRQFTGFVLNTTRQSDLNIFSEIISVLLPLFLWCIANWCLTTLTEGEGSLKDIYTYTAYSLLPMILILIPLILYSRIVTVEEIGFYNFFIGLGYFWSFFLIFCGTLVTHQFTFGKTIFSVIVIIVGMCVIAFIGLLFFNIIQQIGNFISEVYVEYISRV